MEKDGPSGAELLAGWGASPTRRQPAAPPDPLAGLTGPARLEEQARLGREAHRARMLKAQRQREGR